MPINRELVRQIDSRATQLCMQEFDEIQQGLGLPCFTYPRPLTPERQQKLLAVINEIEAQRN